MVGILLECSVSKNFTVRILVINENKALSSVIRCVLEEAGHDVIMTENGHEGYEKMGETMPDLVIVDLLISFVTAYEIIDHIRNINKKYIKIIIMSSVTLDVAVESAFELGVDDYIYLPLKPKELLARIGRLSKYTLAS